jgi:hypothetical protein
VERSFKGSEILEAALIGDGGNRVVLLLQQQYRSVDPSRVQPALETHSGLLPEELREIGSFIACDSGGVAEG